MPNFAIKTNLVIQAEKIVNFFFLFIVNYDQSFFLWKLQRKKGVRVLLF